jgi:hypothetical protein
MYEKTSVVTDHSQVSRCSKGFIYIYIKKRTNYYVARITCMHEKTSVVTDHSQVSRCSKGFT